MNKMDQIEDILSDVDALIGSFLEAEEPENARALVEQFGEWFLDYGAGKEINVTCLEFSASNDLLLLTPGSFRSHRLYDDC